MQRSDLDGIKRSGALACRRGASFFDNPRHHDAGDSWMVAAQAGAAGWCEEDAGRDGVRLRNDVLPLVCGS